ncbi:inorganic diphosphatase [Luteipulveratus sp. YIM 133132]|uniref:Inorganic pyrophosphatase n=1 Tax=Luteipulveratus flavus TaxID=3031728 RepID=A0ABT6C7H3_9MICO|nr:MULTISPECIES: inorganic diphosphatase [unclassified Luteipulveratus]MDE9366900.1 inorganic diphosphatase [Luteipulveratus sp. YIM 133132]MDF8264730.1 inorganic diphosphatase [Luteipulveratus sp. YIM 133296]
MEFDVTIEIPRGTRNKYEIDHETGRIRLDRLLFTAMSYPADYGYIEDTLGEDGDPLDALVLLDEPTFPGCIVRARAVGVFKMVDEAGGDDKILCVPAGDPRKDGVQDTKDVSEFTLKETQHFFETYKALEPGKSVEEGSHWVGADEAVKVVEDALKRAKDQGVTTARWAMPAHDSHDTERSIDRSSEDSQAAKPEA